MNRVPIADSDAQTRLGIKLLLRRQNLDVDEARNGDEALLKLGIREYRVIFLASAMMTSAGQTVMSSRFAGKGLAGCLHKPYTLAKLRSLLFPLLPKAVLYSKAEQP